MDGSISGAGGGGKWRGYCAAPARRKRQTGIYQSCEGPAPPSGPLPPGEQPTIRLQIARRHSESGDDVGCVALAATAGTLWTTWPCLASAASVSLLLRHAIGHEQLAPIKGEAEEQLQHGPLEKEKEKCRGLFSFHFTLNFDFFICFVNF